MKLVVFWEKKYPSYPRRQGKAGLGETSGAKIRDEATGSSRLFWRGLQDFRDSDLQTSQVRAGVPISQQGARGGRTANVREIFVISQQ